MRAFVAIDLPDFGSAATGLPGSTSAGRHLTLRFFADLQESERPLVERCLSEVAGATPPFRLGLAGIGAFPTLARPRLAYADVALGRAEVVELARRIDASLSHIGIPSDPRPFRPHVTILRVHSADQAAAVRVAAGRKDPDSIVELEVREIVLKESELAPQGARHRLLSAFPLGG